MAFWTLCVRSLSTKRASARRTWELREVKTSCEAPPRPAARISTIVRRSASHAVLDAPRPIIRAFESPYVAR
ncbi:hypothetical protein CXB36_23260 [Pseudomonas syringae pv. syringae]|nr:hypothetical protein BKC06_002315 [Pseudomonas syringae pv. syringae]POP62102.1 hypothetical protein CXB36_23260 [Pseudomonas syringae pv. syringae]